MTSQQASTCQDDLLNQSACSSRDASLVDKLEYYTQPLTLSDYKHLICNYEIWNDILQMPGHTVVCQPVSFNIYSKHVSSPSGMNQGPYFQTTNVMVQYGIS